MFGAVPINTENRLGVRNRYTLFPTDDGASSNRNVIFACDLLFMITFSAGLRLFGSGLRLF